MCQRLEIRAVWRRQAAEAWLTVLAESPPASTRSINYANGRRWPVSLYNDFTSQLSRGVTGNEALSVAGRLRALSWPTVATKTDWGAA